MRSARGARTVESIATRTGVFAPGLSGAAFVHRAAGAECAGRRLAAHASSISGRCRILDRALGCRHPQTVARCPVVAVQPGTAIPACVDCAEHDVWHSRRCGPCPAAAADHAASLARVRLGGAEISTDRRDRGNTSGSRFPPRAFARGVQAGAADDRATRPVHSATACALAGRLSRRVFPASQFRIPSRVPTGGLEGRGRSATEAPVFGYVRP